MRQGLSVEDFYEYTEDAYGHYEQYAEPAYGLWKDMGCKFVVSTNSAEWREVNEDNPHAIIQVEWDSVRTVYGVDAHGTRVTRELGHGCEFHYLNKVMQALSKR